MFASFSVRFILFHPCAAENSVFRLGPNKALFILNACETVDRRTLLIPTFLEPLEAVADVSIEFCEDQ